MAIKISHTFVRLVGLGVTGLGMLLVASQNLVVVPFYAAMAVALMLGLWTLGVLAARVGVNAVLVVVTVVVGMVAPLVSLTGEWPLCVLAGVGALAQSEDLTARMGRRLERTVTHENARAS